MDVIGHRTNVLKLKEIILKIMLLDNAMKGYRSSLTLLKCILVTTLISELINLSHTASNS